MLFWLSPPSLFYIWGKGGRRRERGGERGPQNNFPCLDMKNQINSLYINANTFFSSLPFAKRIPVFAFPIFPQKSHRGVFFPSKSNVWCPTCELCLYAAIALSSPFISPSLPSQLHHSSRPYHSPPLLQGTLPSRTLQYLSSRAIGFAPRQAP